MALTYGAARAPRAAANIWAAATGHFLNDLYGNVYPVLVPLIMGPLHLTVLLAAWITSTQGLTSSLLQPMWGYVSDRTIGVRMASYALLAGSLVVGLVGLAPSYAVLLGLVVLGGVANAAYHPSAAAMVHRFSSANRGRSMSVFMVAGNVGRAVGPTIAGLAALWAAERSIGLIAIPGIAVALWVVVRLHGVARAEDAAGVAAAAENSPAPGNSPSLSVVLRTVWQRALPAGLILLMSASRSIVTTAVVTFLPLRYREAGGPVLVGALLVGVLLGFGSIGNAIGGSLSDRMPRTWVVAAASLLAAGFMTLFVASTGVWTLILLAMTGFSASSVSSVVMVMGQELFPEHVATASGMVLGWGNAVAALGTGILAIVAQHAGIDAALYAAAALSAIGTPLALLYPSVRRRVVGEAAP